MPREFLAFNRGMRHKVLFFANLLTSISYLRYFLSFALPLAEAWVVRWRNGLPCARMNLICYQLVVRCVPIFFQLWLSFYVK